MSRPWFVGVFAVIGVACGPAVIAGGSPDSETGTSASSGVETTNTTTSTGGSPSTTSGRPTDSQGGSVTTDPTDPSETSVGFIEDGDHGTIYIECSTWTQDCPAGMKCMPWANNGGSSWNATKCSPLDPNPSLPGEECTVSGNAVSGVDDCDVTSMCWYVDPETNQGTCVSFCTNEANPECPDPCDSCTITGSGVLTICLSGCDPLAQDCAAGQGCYPYGGGQHAFVCAPTFPEPDPSAAPQPCEFFTGCEAGYTCTQGEFVPGCVAGGCCTPFCSTGVLDTCDELVPGTSCTPYFEGEVPACVSAGLGLCLG